MNCSNTAPIDVDADQRWSQNNLVKRAEEVGGRKFPILGRGGQSYKNYFVFLGPEGAAGQQHTHKEHTVPHNGVRAMGINPDTIFFLATVGIKSGTY